MAEVVIDIIGKDNFSGVLGNFGNIMTGIKSTIDLVSGAFNAAVNAVSPFIDAAMESENSVANLEATLKSTGGAVGLTSQQLQDMATGFQQVTKFSDDTIINGEAMLLTFTNIGGDVFPAATEAMLNLAEKFGSVDSASVQLGKALNDPVAGITALTRVGVSFTEAQKDTIKAMVDVGDVAGAQGVILAELEKEFGGLAVAMGDTFAGKVEILKNRFGEMQETIGKALIPILETLMDKFVVYIPMIEDFVGKIANVLNSIADSGLFSAETKEAILGGLFGVDNVGELFAKADTFIANVITAISDAVNTWASGTGPDELSNKIITFIDKLGTGAGVDSKALTAMGNLLAALARAVGNINWGDIANAIDTKLASAVDSINWNSVVSSIGAGISSGIKNIFNTMSTTTVDAKWLFRLLAPGLYYTIEFFKNSQVGQSIVNAIVEGMNAVEVNITNWFRDHIVTPIKTFFGISSPSTMFMDIGKNIVLGLIAGFENNVNLIKNAILKVIEAILGPLQPILDFLGIDINIGSATQTGTTGGGTSNWPGGGGSTPSTGATGVTNNFYGNVYVGTMSELYQYDCPPNAVQSGTSGGFVPIGVH